jgi:uncharacterized protein
VPCSYDPLTGWYRDGCCHTDAHDHGSHVICARVTVAFLNFQMERGNDLITPRPGTASPGLKPGDRWCVCAAALARGLRRRRCHAIRPWCWTSTSHALKALDLRG